MANDVIYPGGVVVSDAKHTALQILGQHPQNGQSTPVTETPVEPTVPGTPPEVAAQGPVAAEPGGDAQALVPEEPQAPPATTDGQ
jgi:hypothetical protein